MDLVNDILNTSSGLPNDLFSEFLAYLKLLLRFLLWSADIINFYISYQGKVSHTIEETNTNFCDQDIGGFKPQEFDEIENIGVVMATEE